MGDNFEHTFFNNDYIVKKLIELYNKHGKIILAYDFDETVYSGNEDSLPVTDRICDLLVECSKYPDDIVMILYTCRSGKDLDEAIEYLNVKGIRHDSENENCSIIKETAQFDPSSKVVYNIFLDDKTGLVVTYTCVLTFLLWLKAKKGGIDVLGLLNKFK